MQEALAESPKQKPLPMVPIERGLHRWLKREKQVRGIAMFRLASDLIKEARDARQTKKESTA